jgi:hypothetical protein
MPICPIDGAYYWPELHSYAAPMALEVGDETGGASGLALSVRGPFSRATPMSLDVGELWESEGRMGLDVGESRSAPARVGFDVRGYSPSSGSRMGLTVTPEPSSYPAYMALEVSSSAAANGVAYMALEVRGYTQRSDVRMALTVRNVTERPAFMALQVRELRESLSPMTLDIGIVRETMTPLALDVMKSDGFLTLVNVVGAGFASISEEAPAGYYPSQDITARLFVDGVQVDIRSFNYERPKGRLGASLNVVLVSANRTLAPMKAAIRFELVVTLNGGELVHALVDGGKVAGRTYDIKWSGRGPGDELSISALDVIGDRFAIVPQSRQPIIMFDPVLVKMTDVQGSVRDAVQTELGGVILPVLEPAEGLTMLTALRRAYTGLDGYGFMTHLRPSVRATLTRLEALVGGEASRASKGLGFETIVTNIPDYFVTRVDWGLETTWHDGVQPLVGMFTPIYSAEGNALLVLDPFRPLPVGHTPRVVPVSQYSRMALEQQYREPYNAVLLTYQERGTDPFDAWAYRPKVTQSVAVDGGFGTPAYQRVELTDTSREKYLLIDPTHVIDEQPVSHEEKTYGYSLVPIPGDGGDYTLGPGLIVQVAREIQQDFYGPDGLKSGHHKDVYGLVDRASHFALGSSVEPILIATEDCDITWDVHPSDPSQMIQTRNFTRFEGLIYESERTETRGGQDVRVRYPVAAAQNSPGVIKDDGRMFFGPTKTITETLWRSGTVLNVKVVDRDLVWSGTPRVSYTAPRTGTRSANPYEARSRTILLRDLTSEAEIGPRVPLSISAGELSRDRALELGMRYLEQGVNRSPEYPLTIAGIDFALTQGSVIKGEFRDGSLTETFIVEGLNISGQGLGIEGQHQIIMSLDGTEVTT